MNKRKRALLSRQQLIGAVVLVVLIAAVEVFIHIVPQRTPPVADSDELSEMADSLSSKRYRYTYDTVRIVMQTFDPNIADSATLLQLGFKRWQVRNLIKYREHGGVYRRKTDLKKLYGMTDSMYLALEPYIRIDTTLFCCIGTIQRDTIRLRYSSLKRDTIIELNSADTLSLQCIRGIGAGIAKQIIRYRTQLGGYYSPAQIREIESLRLYDQDTLMTFCFDSVLPHLTACADSIRPIPVNHSSVQRLQHHPYLRFEQAKALYTLRRNKFRLQSIDQLRTLPEFTESDLERLRLYLSFEQ